MKPSQLKCYPQVAAVIGEAFADYELQKVIDCGPNPIINETLCGAFWWGDSPQKHIFWDLIYREVNPYDHGHEKPEVKEWAYIHNQYLDFEDEWFCKKDNKWVASDGTFYQVSYGDIEILATHKSVTMPDWVPAEVDNLDYNPEDVAFSARLKPEKITLSKEDFDNFVTKCGEAESSEVTPYLPSFGEVCNVQLGDGKSIIVTIVGKKLNGCLIWEYKNWADSYRHPEAQVGKFSPYISEEDKVLNKASAIISNTCLTEELKMLYDAGMLKLPEGE